MIRRAIGYSYRVYVVNQVRASLMCPSTYGAWATYLRFMAGDIAHELSAQSAPTLPACLSSRAIGLSARGRAASHGLLMERLQLRPGAGRGHPIFRHGGYRT